MTSPPRSGGAASNPSPQNIRRRRGGLALLLGLSLLAGAVAIAVVAPQRSVVRISLAEGPPGTTRALIARALVAEAKARGADARTVETVGTRDGLEQVESRAVDFAIVSGLIGLGAHPHVREVAPLQLEALHLAVRAELADAVGRSLGALRGRIVDLGPQGSSTTLLAQAVMAFAGLTPGDGTAPDTFVARNLQFAELEALAVGESDDARPDAFFHFGSVPSEVVLRALRMPHYRLVALPFAKAFHLNAIIAETSPAAPVTGVDRLSVTDAVIPGFTYRAEPPEPPAPLHTLGGCLLLVAHEDVPVESVELVLHAAFGSRFARLAEPHLHHSLLELPPHLTRHPGTLAYLRRDESLITNQSVDELNNTLGILGGSSGAPSSCDNGGVNANGPGGTRPSRPASSASRASSAGWRSSSSAPRSISSPSPPWSASCCT
jgi:TRAP-type uncharacterized transport system substrate-binding protein